MLTNCVVYFNSAKNKKHTACQKSSPRFLMRNIIPAQLQMGEIDVADVVIESNNRDEIPQLLTGFQHIYKDPATRTAVFKELWNIIPEKTDKTTGRQGMSLWRILVLGTLRMCCNWDYDKLQEIANNHRTLRLMLGHGLLDINFNYSRQTLNDNLRLFTPEVLDRINKIIVNAGFSVLCTNDKEKIKHARCDSFVVETDVHFPTDINLLWDAVRKSMELSSKVAVAYSIAGWRQYKHNLREIKSLYRSVQIERDRNKDSGSTVKATQRFVDKSMIQLLRAEKQVGILGKDISDINLGSQIEWFVTNGKKLIDQISRRCFANETIPHNEKIFSLFEPHTEWIQKGKAGKPQELGLRVCIMESSAGFILHHKIMEQKTDDAVAVEIVKETQTRYPETTGVSFDKGFHSPENQRQLALLLKHCTLPRKGKLNEQQKAIENSEVFVERRRKHAAVESAINALEQHGLDRCNDKGLDGFKRYVAISVVARNIQLIGAIVQKKDFFMQKNAA